MHHGAGARYDPGMNRSAPPALALALAAGALACPAPDPVFREVRFPDGFAFGTANAQWQAAGDFSPGGPIGSNWSAWCALERVEGGQLNPAGSGFYTDYTGEIDRAVALGLDTFRTGVDWSRVEPAPDTFDEAELDHLVATLEEMRGRGLDPVLTLWHWVVPLWVQSNDPSAPWGRVDLLAEPSGEIVDHFDDYVRRVIPRVKGLVDTYTVLNEPLSVIAAGYLNGLFPPGRLLDAEGAAAAGVNLAFMQARAHAAIKALDDVDADGDGSASLVGITMTASGVYPHDPDNPAQQHGAERIGYLYNDWLLQAVVEGRLDVDLDGRVERQDTTPPEGFYPELQGTVEFIGVQYYGPVYVDDHPLFVDFFPLYGLPQIDVRLYDPARPHNGMGREIWAGGLRDTLEIYARWGLPLIVTENGTTGNDYPVRDDDGNLLDEAPVPAQAAMYLVEHLWELGRALERGVDVRGYYHWTLSDNFEWAEGWHQRFGAYRVDLDAPDLARTLSPMGEALAEVVAARGIDEALWRRHVLERYPTDGRADAPAWTTSEAPWGVPEE